MKALSVWQPWAWLLVHGHEHENGKRIENRAWTTTNVGCWVLIHASKYPALASTQSGMSKNLQRQMFLSLRACERAGLPLEHLPTLSRLRFGGIVGAVYISQCVEASDSPWFTGPYGLETGDAFPVPFSPTPGRQRWWNVINNDLETDTLRELARRTE